ncbi:MAG: hypothetical protein AVDCRST_MAG49-1991 [uncultured Thermomicrobiales bacterium]|uniref:Uncharacterized protein n=1 Tax=uncultured Thermomicrobiales bacterium TaxID=1645740 RepID=A0A6J4UPK8_9BACT|nr:MAG: hypothetical protein AVDCRST_MAG49-1991 [uncultured Thermomicrobiales bacterium]
MGRRLYTSRVRSRPVPAAVVAIAERAAPGRSPNRDEARAGSRVGATLRAHRRRRAGLPRGLDAIHLTFSRCRDLRGPHSP